MTRAEHGTTARERSGCRCGPCRYARAAARAVARPLGDPEVVQRHVRMLSAAGIGQRRVAELAGIGAATLSRILYCGARPHATTVDKVLSVQADAPPARRTVPAVGVVRRLQALRAAGWPNSELGPMIGVEHNSVSLLTSGRREGARRSTAKAVTAVYAELSARPLPDLPVSPRTRTLARMHGWFMPLAWDDDTLDDPDALPCLLPSDEVVPRDVELAVQHLAARHRVDVTAEARTEFVRRTLGWKVAKVAEHALCDTRTVQKIRQVIGR